MTQKPLIEFRNASKFYGEVCAIDNVSFTIYEKEFFALLGPSGCGKSTLLRMLAGFEKIDRGEILLNGQSLTGVPPNKRPVNMMFQSYALFPHMSVEKNIAFGLLQEKMNKADMQKRVADMLKLVKLQPFAKRKPEQLSGGQKQRVALARAIAKQPKVLLLDEPLGALDRKLREETQFELVDLQERLEITFLVVTHDQEEAMTMADRIAVMEKGKPAQIAPPIEMYEKPNSIYVADFLGDINIINGKITQKQNNKITITTPEGETLEVLQTNAQIKTAIGDEVAFAIRPQKMTIDRANNTTLDTNTLQGTVQDIAYLGDMTIYRIKLTDNRILQVSILNREIAEQPINWEEKVTIKYKPEHAMILRP